jgi:UPF0755 protein
MTGRRSEHGTEQTGVRQRDRESFVDSGGSHDDLFFDGDHDGDADSDLLDDHLDGRPGDDQHGDDHHDGGPRRSRVEAKRHSRRRSKRRFIALLALLLVGVVAVAGYFVALPIYHYFSPADYDGRGSGSVVITIRANDGASQIGDTLTKQGVVASIRAFTDAASGNSAAQNIQPGSYRLRHHMSASNALTLLLDPSSRVNSDIVVTEGATVPDVEKRLTAPPCTATSPANTICGLGLDPTEVTKALADVKALGLPTDYNVGGQAPSSVEGLLYPATYPFDDKTSAVDALQQMVGKFTDQVRGLQLSAAAKQLRLTPYQLLIVASIAQAEAKFPADYAKVARVILNRIAVGRHLQIDATSAYWAKLTGKDPAKIIYAAIPGPYNSYTHAGLPPTPIGNPGAEALTGAASPPAGNWLYYVNGDAAGHLFFTDSEAAFTKAVAKCKAQNWGCG